MPGFRPVERGLALAPSERRVLEETLDPGAAVAGLVVDDRGEPVAGARVVAAWDREARDPAGERPRSGGRAVTDAWGRFRVAGLAPGPHLLEVRGEDVAVEERPVEAPCTDTRVVAPRRGGFRFRMVRPAGAAGEFRLEHSIHHSRGGLGSGTDYGAGADPVYESTGHAAGALRFEGRVEGFVPFGWELEIPPGALLDLGEVVLDPGVALEGVVRDERGEVFEGLRLRATGKGWGRDYDVEAFTDGEGRFRLAPLPGTEVRVAATLAWMTLFETALVPDRDPARVEWTVPRAAFLSILVTDPRGGALTGVALRARGMDGAPDVVWDAEYTSGGDGRIGMVVPPGRYGLELVRRGTVSPVGEVGAAPGERVERTFVLPPR